MATLRVQQNNPTITAIPSKSMNSNHATNNIIIDQSNKLMTGSSKGLTGTRTALKNISNVRHKSGLSSVKYTDLTSTGKTNGSICDQQLKQSSSNIHNYRQLLDSVPTRLSLLRSSLTRKQRRSLRISTAM